MNDSTSTRVRVESASQKKSDLRIRKAINQSQRYFLWCVIELDYNSTFDSLLFFEFFLSFFEFLIFFESLVKSHKEKTSRSE